MTIGILGLQGCCVPHERMFAELGVATKRVLYPADLDDVDGLVMPGGESTTMLKTAHDDLREALRAFGRQRPVWGVCAGCILMASEVTHPEQPGLGLLDMAVARNAYGAQLDSFIANVELALSPSRSVRCIFIRAPRITRIGADIRVLGNQGDDPIIVETDRHLATTFHPELTDSPAVHRYFLSKVKGAIGR